MKAKQKKTKLSNKKKIYQKINLLQLKTIQKHKPSKQMNKMDIKSTIHDDDDDISILILA